VARDVGARNHLARTHERADFRQCLKLAEMLALLGVSRPAAFFSQRFREKARPEYQPKCWF
jgi:hypothetical protein